jgi:hypothetical protein
MLVIGVTPDAVTVIVPPSCIDVMVVLPEKPDGGEANVCVFA